MAWNYDKIQASIGIHYFAENLLISDKVELDTCLFKQRDRNTINSRGISKKMSVLSIVYIQTGYPLRRQYLHPMLQH